MRTPIHHSRKFKLALFTLLLAGMLSSGSGMPGRAIAAETYAGSYKGCANPGDQTDIPEAECDALVALYNSAGGASWTINTDWLATDTPCSWYNVDCSSVPGYVTDLDLSSNNLTGSIPSELGSISNLDYLGLDYNQLSGSIPAELGNLTNLLNLYLNNNQLSGPLPQEFTNLTSLSYLYYNLTNLCAPDNVAFQNWMAGVTYKGTTTLYCEVVFSDGFESGNTSAWSSMVEGPLQTGGLFSDQYIPPGLGLIVHPKAAYLGGYGLGAIVEDKHPMFVQDDSPSAETSYRARFYLLVKSLTADPYKGMGILLGSGTGKSFQMFAGWDGAQHVIVARVGEDHGAWTWTNFYTIPTNEWVLVEIEWVIATGDGSDDGFFILYLDGVIQEVVPALDNDAASVDTVRLGPSYVSPGATGIIGFDAFSSEDVYSP